MLHVFRSDGTKETNKGRTREIGKRLGSTNAPGAAQIGNGLQARSEDFQLVLSLTFLRANHLFSATPFLELLLMFHF